MSSPQVLATHYGGQHTGSWVDRLPASWIPYIQLARLSPPAGVFLVLFPHIFGLLNGAILREATLAHTLRVGLYMISGSFFLSNAIHGWNDLIDAPIDRLIPRTRGRPVARGAISPRDALLFTISQGMAGASLLLALPREATWAAIPSVVGNFYYPWSKRHTHYAQLVLGFSLAWGVPMGTAAMGVKPWSSDALVPTTCLCLSSVLWTAIYDTIYAFQDVADDEKLGLKSMAVLFRQQAKIVLFVILGCLVSLLATYGHFYGMTGAYYLVGCGGCLSSLGLMIANVDLKNPQSCWWWFRYGFWFAGGSITGGLLTRYYVLYTTHVGSSQVPPFYL
ncbi:prenyltransferase [Xylaria telfairii]|nr:prenyltransferase [Xylaria telfairii]